MNKLIIFQVLVMLLCVSSAYAVSPKYAVHTSREDIDFKKYKALNWYNKHSTDRKLYFIDTTKEISLKKNKALKWYEDNIAKGKFYFVDSKAELENAKKKSLKWHEKNSL